MSIIQYTIHIQISSIITMLFFVGFFSILGSDPLHLVVSLVSFSLEQCLCQLSWHWLLRTVSQFGFVCYFLLIRTRLYIFGTRGTVSSVLHIKKHRISVGSITRDDNFDCLVKVVYSRFLYCKNYYPPPFVINKWSVGKFSKDVNILIFEFSHDSLASMNDSCLNQLLLMVTK